MGAHRHWRLRFSCCKTILLQVVLLTSLLFTSCSDNDDNYRGNVEKQTFYDENNRLIAEIETLNGVKHGVSKWYRKDGSLEIVAEYHKGKQHGYQHSYYENGNIGAITNYYYGYMKGKELQFFENDSGKVREELNHMILDNKSVPISRKEYNIDGDLIEESSRVEIKMQDTLNLEQDFKVKFSVINPEYDNITVFLMDYDSLFTTYNKESVKSFHGIGNSVEASLKADRRGENFLRGYVSDFTIKPISDSTGKTVENALYFEKQYFVK